MPSEKTLVVINLCLVAVLFAVCIGICVAEYRKEHRPVRDPLCTWAIAKVEHIEGVTDPLRESE